PRPSIWTVARRRTSQRPPSTTLRRAPRTRRRADRRGSSTGRKAPRAHRAVPWPRRRIPRAGDARRKGARQTPRREPGLLDPDHLDRAEPVPESEGRQSKRRSHWRRAGRGDRKSTRLNSSHVKISYAVFCLKKKTKKQ